ncbi:hypothetical protein Z043_121316 [Scleropages formosus]|uniref:Uncharacterized protein n=1 Tax=Scleropages formosus TaxID=113540 RepID=A0A0P7TI87_SCLFO|nr:hypothetical protein Z043_121316 [Scleropages formosus]
MVSHSAHGNTYDISLSPPRTWRLSVAAGFPLWRVARGQVTTGPPPARPGNTRTQYGQRQAAPSAEMGSSDSDPLHMGLRQALSLGTAPGRIPGGTRKLKMMAEGKLASLPRGVRVGSQCSLASSMDLLSSRPPASDHQSRLQNVSIHGTLPRRKKGPAPVRSWDTYSHTGTLPHPGRSRLLPPPLVHHIIEENHPFLGGRDR